MNPGFFSNCEKAPSPPWGGGGGIQQPTGVNHAGIYECIMKNPTRNYFITYNDDTRIRITKDNSYHEIIPPQKREYPPTNSTQYIPPTHPTTIHALSFAIRSIPHYPDGRTNNLIELSVNNCNNEYLYVNE